MSSSQLLHLLLLLLPLQCCCNCTKYVSCILLLVSSLLSTHTGYHHQHQSSHQQHHYNNNNNSNNRNNNNNTSNNNNKNNINSNKNNNSDNNHTSSSNKSIIYNNNDNINTNQIVILNRRFTNQCTKQQVIDKSANDRYIASAAAITTRQQRGVSTRTHTTDDSTRWKNCQEQQQRQQIHSHGDSSCNFLDQNRRSKKSRAGLGSSSNCNQLLTASSICRSLRHCISLERPIHSYASAYNQSQRLSKAPTCVTSPLPKIVSRLVVVSF